MRFHLRLCPHHAGCDFVTKWMIQDQLLIPVKYIKQLGFV